ncbi:MAG TPA: GNAT family N-acetyltransferase [Thermoplasmata archaeon]|nr:GNAT family N-acetyltransferase [Thermoplasmata archaeon]
MAMTRAFVVRGLRREDGATVLELARSLGRWFNAEGLSQMARGMESYRGYVAATQNRIVGFLLWAPADLGVAELSWMGVSEEFQRRGVGTTLLSAAVAELRSAGFRTLEVSTVADSVDYEPYARTRKFYRARGFADFRVDPGYWGAGDDRYDRLVLRRDL